MIYGYARVSTKGQAKDGNSLEAQTALLKEAGADKVYADSFTGTKMDRPEFDKLKAVLETGDTLIVTKLDRFARSATQGIEMIEDLIKKGVKVHVLNMGVMDDTPTGKLIRNIMLSFAEFERDMIYERTQEGKAIKRAKGLKAEGRNKLDIDMDLFEELYSDQQSGLITVKEAIRILNISRSSWYNLVKAN